MQLRRSPLLVYSLALLASPLWAQAPAQPTPAPADTPAAAAKDASPQPPAATGAPTIQQDASAKKPHKVYTNEDFDARPHEFEVDGARELLDQIYGCNRQCFDDVARRVNIPASSNVKWKQTLLNAIDTVKEDLNWQALLREGLSIQVQSCELQVQRRQDLLRFSDPRTVTHSELMVERSYEPKFRAITQRLADFDKRADAYVAKNVSAPYQAQFMLLQLERVMHANCQITVKQQGDDNRDADNSDDP